MRTLKMLTLGLAALMLAGTLAVAQDDENDGRPPRRDRRRPQNQNQDRDQDGQGSRHKGRRPGPAGGFLFGYMRENEEYKKAFDEFRESQEATHEKMKALREKTRAGLQAATTDEEREKIIADAKQESKKLLTDLVTGMIEHRQKISGMLVDDKDDIVESAMEKIYQHRRRRQGGDGDAQGRGPRRGDRRGDRRGQGRRGGNDEE